jgi:hypothetical protein
VPAIALPLNNLAQTLAQSGRAAEALAIQQRALQISEAALPAEHSDIARRLGNVGSSKLSGVEVSAVAAGGRGAGA